MDLLHKKKQRLEEYLSGLNSVAIAFSSGVDSTFLLKIAHDILGDKAIALTARSSFFPSRESGEAASFCEKENIGQVIIDIDEHDIDGFCSNPKDRCYLCKRELFRRFTDAAFEKGIYNIAEGSNIDDMGDYRPGLKAIAELGIKSPLREAGLTKDDIRILSKELGLETWDKPSFACLASRFVYGESITREKLQMVEKQSKSCWISVFVRCGSASTEI